MKKTHFLNYKCMATIVITLMLVILTALFSADGNPLDVGKLADCQTTSANELKSFEEKDGYFIKDALNERSDNDENMRGIFKFPIYDASNLNGNIFFESLSFSEPVYLATNEIERDLPESEIIITTQPTAYSTFFEGEINGTLSFTANSTSGAFLLYQWYSNTVNSNQNGTAIPGETDSVLTIPTNLTASDDPYYYYCVATSVIPITFLNISANGEEYKETTTKLTLTFSGDITGLSSSHITLTGAQKGNLEKTALGTYDLSISDVTVAEGEEVTVTIDKIPDYLISPDTLAVPIHKHTLFPPQGPENIVVVEGTTLGDVILSIGWTWVLPNTTSVGAVGENIFYANFTGNSENCAAENIPIKLIVISDPNIGMDGTSSKPFKVYNETTLKYVALGNTNPTPYKTWTVNNYYEQINNIYLSDRWVSGSYNFNGTYDGKGYIIDGMVGNRAFIDQINASGIVKNVGLVNKNAPDAVFASCGALTMVNRGTVMNCFVTGIVSNVYNTAGGIVGTNEAAAVVIDCVSLLTSVNGKTAGRVAGVNNGIITNCYSRYDVEGSVANFTQKTLTGKDGADITSENIEDARTCLDVFGSNAPDLNEYLPLAAPMKMFLSASQLTLDGVSYAVSNVAAVKIITHTYTITHDVTSDSFTFPEASFNYNEQEPLSVVITNTGNTTLASGTIALLSGASFNLSKTTLGEVAPGATDEFTIAPKTQLIPGTYTDIVTVSGTPGNETVSFTVSFKVLSLPIASPAVTLTAPQAGEVPGISASGGSYYSCDLVQWTPDDFTAAGEFKCGTVYTATITLTADTGYTFNGLSSATIGEEAAVIVNNTGNTVTLVRDYTVTAAHVSDEAHDSDCTEPSTCTVCGMELTAAGTHVSDEAHDSDCTEPSTCTVCGMELTAAGTHTPGIEATCTTNQICTICLIELETARGHSWETDFTIDKDPTLTETGLKSIHCSECQEKKDITVIPEFGRVVTVNNGTGNGLFAIGSTVTIIANPAPDGQRFREWDISPSVAFTNGTGSTTGAASFILPQDNVTATAIYEDLPPALHNITVTNSEGGIAYASVISAAQGRLITLVAVANEGYHFKQWQVISGGVIISENSTFSMPNSAVEIRAVFEIIPTYEVSGKVINSNDEPLSGAVISLIKNGQTMFTTTTDENGEFLFENIDSGLYNIVSQYTDTEEKTTIVTQIITLEGDKDIGAIKIPVGRKNSVFENSGDVLVSVIGGLDEIYENVKGDESAEQGVTEEDLVTAESGGIITVRLEAKLPDIQGQSNEISDVESKAGENNKITGITLDLSAYKEVKSDGGDIEITPLTELNSLIRVYISLPPEMQGKTGYAVYRHHNGIVDEITQTPNADGEYFTVEGASIILTVKKFSLYSIAYNDPETGDETVTVRFNPNGGFGLMTEEIIAKNGSYQLPENKFLRDRHTFDGWKIDNTGDTLAAGTSVTVSADITLYPQWTYNKSNHSGGTTTYNIITVYHTVEFDADGGSAVKSQKIINKGSAVEPDDPIKDGYDFVGWFLDSELKKPYDFDMAVTKNLVLYAKWERATAEQPETGAIKREKPFIRGYDDGAFRPDAIITRAEAAQVLYNLFAEGAVGDQSVLLRFDDIDASHWAAKSMAWAIEQGYLKGFGDKTVRPDSDVTRAEFAAILNRVAGREDLLRSDGFMDVRLSDIDGHWAQADILALAKEGVIRGYPDGTFKPENTVSRAEAVAMLARLLGRSEEFIPGKMFNDVSEGHWAYYTIMNAANGI